MNKPYFTKYLKSDKELSWYLQDGEMIEREWYGPTGGFNREIVPYKTGMQSLSEKRVKLFLCSRDIQVGDEVRYVDNEFGDKYNHLYVSGVDDKFVIIKGSKENLCSIQLKKHEVFKVIGEVSPNAIWVKEGMEFDNNDIEWKKGFVAFYNEHGESTTLAPFEQQGAWSKITYPYIKFKCSNCNTFH
jgi:hypothetical protein